MELVWEEDGLEQSVELGPDRAEVMVGRHKDCDIRVSRPSVSRRHCLFSWNNGNVIVTDQESTAGTYIDGKKIRRSRVDPGTAVNCGGVIVLLDEASARGRASAPAARSAPVDDFFSDTPPRRAAPPPVEEPPSRRRAPPVDEEPPSRRRAPPVDEEPPSRRRAPPVVEEAPPPRRAAADDIDSLFDDPPVRRRRADQPTAEAEPKRSRRSAPADDFFSSSDPEPLPAPAKAAADDFFSTPDPEPLPAPKRGGGFDPDAFFGSDDGFDDWEAPAAEPEPEPEPEPPAPVAAPRVEHHAVYLLYVDDDGAEQEVRVEKDAEPILIGRRSGASVKVRNPSVSGKHCTVGYLADEVVVRDLGSSNGTFINNDRVRRGTVIDGDIVRCGRFELRVSFVAHKELAQAEYEEWGDDDWGEDLDMGPPRYHLIYSDDRGELTSVTMGEHERVLAVGSEGCEINIEKREVEPEHCELTWDEGVLVVTDLRSETGTFVNEEAVEDETVRNGDVIIVGLARIHVVRGCSVERKPPLPENRSDIADIWTRHLDNRDDDLEILFIDGEETDEGGKHELSLWGNGESRIEIITETDRYSVTGMIDRDLRRLIYESLLRAGYPDTATSKVRPGEEPPEVNVFQGRDESRVLLTKALVQRSPGYHEVLEVLRAVCTEMSAGT